MSVLDVKGKDYSFLEANIVAILESKASVPLKEKAFDTVRDIFSSTGTINIDNISHTEGPNTH